jgi:hypothetical protein
MIEGPLSINAISRLNLSIKNKLLSLSKIIEMKLTIEVSSQSELEKIILFFQTLKLDSVRIISDSLTPKPKKTIKKEIKVIKGDKSIDPTELFGMWADDKRPLEEMRQNAWGRNKII